MLIGANPSINYNRAHDEATKKFYAGLLRFAGKVPDVAVSDDRVIARLHQAADRKYLWLINPTNEPVKVTVNVTDCRALGKVYWNDGNISARNGQIQAEIPALDGVTAELDQTPSCT